MQTETRKKVKAAMTAIEEELRCDNGATPNVAAARQYLEFRAALTHREQFAALGFRDARLVSFEPLAFDGYPVSARIVATAALTAQATSVVFLELRSPQSAVLEIKRLSDTLEALGIRVITTVAAATHLSVVSGMPEEN